MKIKSTKSESNNRITALVYGRSGAGKTTLAKTLPGKTLIVSAESGLLSLKDFEIDYVELEGKTAADKIASLKAIIGELMKGVPYDNIFIDSITEISQLFVEMYQNQFQSRSETLLIWAEYNKSMRAFIKCLRDMAPYNIVISCLEKEDKDDLSRKVFLPDMQGKISTQVLQFFDEVFNLKVVMKDEEEKRLLITDHWDGYTCKDRSGRLEKFEQADLSKIFAKIKE